MIPFNGLSKEFSIFSLRTDFLFGYKKSRVLLIIQRQFLIGWSEHDLDTTRFNSEQRCVHILQKGVFFYVCLDVLIFSQHSCRAVIFTLWLRRYLRSLSLWFQSKYWFAALLHYSEFSFFLFIFTYKSHPWPLIMFWIYYFLGLPILFYPSTLPSIIIFSNFSCRIICYIYSFRLFTILDLNQTN